MSIDAKDQVFYVQAAVPAPAQPAAAAKAEAEFKGAVDPVTGEINWNCPCLASSLAGPCGPDFRAAFPCTVKISRDPTAMPAECEALVQQWRECNSRRRGYYNAASDYKHRRYMHLRMNMAS